MIMLIPLDLIITKMIFKKKKKFNLEITQTIT